MADATLTTASVTVTSRSQGRRSNAIVPERSVAGRTLVLLIAIMTFLSGVTLGAVVLVQKSAIAWSSDVGREVTIQIRPVEGEVMDSNIRTAITLAEAIPGVGSARALSLEESQKLLQEYQEAYEKLVAPANRIATFIKFLDNQLALIALGDSEFVTTVSPRGSA